MEKKKKGREKIIRGEQKEERERKYNLPYVFLSRWDQQNFVDEEEELMEWVGTTDVARINLPLI